MRLFKSTNKSQASLEPTTDSRDSSSPTQRDSHIPDTAYSQKSYGGAHYTSILATAHQEQLQQPSEPPSHQQQHHLDERYYENQPQPTHPAHLLSRSPSNRNPSAGGDPYAQQRPAVSVVPPVYANDTIREDRHHVSGQTQFGESQRIRGTGEKEHKKSKRSIFGLGTTKDKKEGPENSADHNRLSRSNSVIKRGGHHGPNSPTGPKKLVPRSESISAYLEKSAAHNRNKSALEDDLEFSSSENLPEDPSHYERYYQEGSRASQQYESPSGQPPRQSVLYVEGVPHFPPPPQSQQGFQYQQALLQQQQQQQSPHRQEYQVHSQDETPEQPKHFFPYPGQPIRSERPVAAVLDIDKTLRPPSQSSLGPPSPVIGPPTSNSRPGSATTLPRFTGQSPLATQSVDQAQRQSYLTQPQSQISPTEAGPTSAETRPLGEMGKGDRERHQRESRMEEQEARYQMQQDPRLRMSAATHEQGRNTPPPRTREDITTLDHQQLLSRYEELQAKYSKVKRYYFEREAQVTQLQNTVATQRLSMSKTSLDDAQYATRFERLNGAIQNLAFNIRKDWRRIPNWLAPACNRDACQIGTKEMTAVGRACISRWLFEKVFQEIFHPGIDPILSSQLKNMERNLRRTPGMLTEEQRDDLLTKVTTWRLTTCEGLQDVLNSRQNEAYTETLARLLAQQLGDYLKLSLNDPPPPGLDDNLLTIVGQTLSISANLPLESRDVCIYYYFPGTPLNDMYMRLESGMTPLANPGSAPSRDDPAPQDEDEADEEKMSTSSERDDGVNVEDQIREASAKAAAGGSQPPNAPNHKQQEKRSEKKSGGMFGGFGGSFVSKKPAPRSQEHGNNRESVLAAKSNTENNHSSKDNEQIWTLETMTRGNKEGKIRFAVFLAIEVRGKTEKKEQNQGQPQNGPNGTSGEREQQTSQQQAQQKSSSAGVGTTASSVAAAGGPNAGTTTSGTSGGAGQGGVNVLVKAPVFSF